jgi:hypothetical protein
MIRQKKGSYTCFKTSVHKTMNCSGTPLNHGGNGAAELAQVFISSAVFSKKVILTFMQFQIMNNPARAFQNVLL